MADGLDLPTAGEGSIEMGQSSVQLRLSMRVTNDGLFYGWSRRRGRRIDRSAFAAPACHSEPDFECSDGGGRCRCWDMTFLPATMVRLAVLSLAGLDL